MKTRNTHVLGKMETNYTTIDRMSNENMIPEFFAWFRYDGLSPVNGKIRNTVAYKWV